MILTASSRIIKVSSNRPALLASYSQYSRVGSRRKLSSSGSYLASCSFSWCSARGNVTPRTRKEQIIEMAVILTQEAKMVTAATMTVAMSIDLSMIRLTAVWRQLFVSNNNPRSILRISLSVQLFFGSFLITFISYIGNFLTASPLINSSISF